MKKCLLLLFILTSCQTPAPTSQPANLRGSASVEQTAEQYTDHVVEEKTLNAFSSMMSAPTDGERSQSISNYLDRQRSFFYIGQGLLAQFDEKLDQLHQQYADKENVDLEQNSNTDFNEFNVLKIKNYIAWEFSERNLHEVLDIYYLTLKHANDSKSKYQQASTWAVENIKNWIKEGYNSNDKMATIFLAKSIESVNEDFVRSHQLQNLRQNDYKIANLSFYANRPDKELQIAYDESLRLAKNRPLRLIDAKLEKEWSQYSAQKFSKMQAVQLDFKKSFRDQLQNFNKNSNIRNPQAVALDELEPSPTGKGNVTGNRFPMGKFAFTFDDGPKPEHTQGMINVLKKHQVHGTFFWQIQNIIKYPDFSKQLFENGFHRASHSYTHPELLKLNSQGLDKEINQASNDFATVVGEKPTLFRCPYGACGPNGSVVRTMIANQNMLHIFWNIDSLDWRDMNPTSIFERCKKQADLLKRGIILFHDVHPQSVKATDMLIAYMKDKYKIEPLNKLIGESRGKPYHSP